ncbi:MAG: penicillin-binding protein 2 [Planctomycetales bacterium]
MNSVEEKSPEQAFLTWRVRLVSGLIFCVCAALFVRLIQLQGMQHTEFTRKVLRQKEVQEPIPAPPGDVVDRSGRMLATTVSTRSLYIVPQGILAKKVSLHELADLLRLDHGELQQKVESHSTQQFLWVKRRLTAEEANAVRGLKLPRGTWGFREEYQRYYPQGQLAAHVIGLRNIDGQGQGGVEQSLDAQLQGKPGWQTLVRDSRGRVIEVCEDKGAPPQPGRTVTLTLDTVLQMFVEETLEHVMAEWRPLSCCSVVLDPRTGQVLAMASRPGFDPNHPERISDNAWKNRPIADIYEPGSTFKPCVIAWAMKQGLLRPDERIHCENGAYRMGKRVLHDHHPYGELSIVEILSKSSNIGMAKIGERLTNTGLYEAATVFGFGHPTGIELPGELSGLVRPLKQWTSYSTGSIPMGQELSTTPLQLIAAYGALVNGGRWIAPHLVLRSDQQDASRIASDVISPEISHWLTQEALTEVVTKGTGRKAQLNGYQVFGKTGTAQKLDPATGTYSHERYVSSFVCGAPADNPRLLVLVSVDEPSVGHDRYGGTVAAPPATAILEQALHHLGMQPTQTAKHPSSKTRH